MNNIKKIIKDKGFMKKLICFLSIISGVIFNINGADDSALRLECGNELSAIYPGIFLHEFVKGEAQEQLLFEEVMYGMAVPLQSILLSNQDEIVKSFNGFVYLVKCKNVFLNPDLKPCFLPSFAEKFNQNAKKLFLKKKEYEKCLSLHLGGYFEDLLPQMNEIVAAGLDAFMLPEPVGDSRLPGQSKQTFPPDAPAAAAAAAVPKVDSLEALAAGVASVSLTGSKKKKGKSKSTIHDVD